MVMPAILSAVLIIAIIFSITVVIRKRREAEVTGIKSALTSICLYLLAITNLLAYWLNFLGIVSWSISVILLIFGAYFTKYLPASEGRS